MQRFFLPPAETASDTLTLSTREAHHALNVVRLRTGEPVVVLNGEGERLWCETAECSKREVRLRVTRRESLPARPWQFTLLQALPKGKAFDTIVQKATELGAYRIIPLLTQRVVAQVEPDRHAGKLDHWRAIAIESIKQCGSPWLPRIDSPTTLSEALTDAARTRPADIRLVGSLRSSARHPRAVFDERGLRRPVPGTSGSAEIWIGPEGDFTDEELDRIETAGAVPITFGSLVLRADTAAIYGLSILSYELNAVTR